MKVSRILKSCFLFFLLISFIDIAIAAPTDNQLKLNGVPIPSVDLSINPPNTPTQLVTTLNIVILLTLLILAPSLVLMMTSFTRILIVLGFLRTALGT